MSEKRNFPDNRIHVLIIGPSPDQVGGVATYISQGFYLVHMDTSQDSKDLGTVVRFTFLNFSYMFYQVYRLFKVLITIPPKIVHLNVTAGWSFWKIAVFLSTSRLFSVKVIAHIHGGFFDLFFNQSGPITQKLIAWVLEQLEVVVALSEGWGKLFLEQVNKSLNVVVISNSPEEFKTKKDFEKLRFLLSYVFDEIKKGSLRSIGMARLAGIAIDLAWKKQ